MTDDRMALVELIEQGADSDLVREMLAFAAERMMDMEIEAKTGITVMFLLTGREDSDPLPPPRPPAFPQGRPDIGGRLIPLRSPVRQAAPERELVEVEDDAARYVALSEDSARPHGKPTGMWPVARIRAQIHALPLAG